VVDSSAPARFEEAKKTLEEHILTNDAVKNCPLLIICTKNDLPTTVSPDELVHQIVDKKFLTLSMMIFMFLIIFLAYQFLTTSSKTGEGLREILGFFKLKAK
jgi:signal recognition particle receptor subunit beta